MCVNAGWHLRGVRAEGWEQNILQKEHLSLGNFLRRSCSDLHYSYFTEVTEKDIEISVTYLVPWHWVGRKGVSQWGGRSFCQQVGGLIR